MFHPESRFTMSEYTTYYFKVPPLVENFHPLGLVVNPIVMDVTSVPKKHWMFFGGSTHLS